jgi:hypothetical protein
MVTTSYTKEDQQQREFKKSANNRMDLGPTIGSKARELLSHLLIGHFLPRLAFAPLKNMFG